MGIDALERLWVVREESRENSAWDGPSWTDHRASKGWRLLADSWSRTVRGEKRGSTRSPHGGNAIVVPKPRDQPKISADKYNPLQSKGARARLVVVRIIDQARSANDCMIRSGCTELVSGTPRPLKSSQMLKIPNLCGACTSHSRLSPTIHASAGCAPS